MKLKLKNIGIIKEAEIKINGLTVIAGKNDSGKSTVGKVLFMLIKTISQSNSDVQAYKNRFNKYIQTLFNRQISKDGTIEFEYAEQSFGVKIKNDKCTEFAMPKEYEYDELGEFRPIVIETPFIWNILATLNTANSLRARNRELDFEISPLIDDLHYTLTRKLLPKDDDIKLNIKTIIEGEFIENNGSFTFQKEDNTIELSNVAMGIKYFGILQVLSNSNYLYKGQILILDEPEVHLHPQWQLKLAEIIVNLVKQGVKILINSHSPYMIEALQRYGQRANIPTNFYLADKHKILDDEESLSKIFAKLSEPFDTFDKMDSEFLNG